MTEFGQYVAECLPKYVQKVQLTAGQPYTLWYRTYETIGTFYFCPPEVGWYGMYLRESSH